jgi:hypothetical protein
LVESVGVKVAVITEVPPPATVSVVPAMLMTDVVADEYVNVPASDPVTPGAVMVKVASPKVLERLLQAEKVGVALPIVRVSVTCGAAP